MTDPYRVAVTPGEKPSGPDVYLDKSESELFAEWKEFAAMRGKLIELMKNLPNNQVPTWTFISSQLAFIDSQMNGVLIARAFQRLRALK